MDPLRECISNQIDIDKYALDDIVSLFEIRKIKRGQFLLESGKNSKEMAFIESGFLRMYDIADGKEITFWIGSEGKFITSVSSFVLECENYWNIQALTDCTLFILTRENHFELCQRQPKWLEFDNLLLAYCYALLEKSMFAQLHTTAQQRFESLLNENPALFNQVPLQYIASMLGITPESLSRLRKNLAHSIS